MVWRLIWFGRSGAQSMCAYSQRSVRYTYTLRLWYAAARVMLERAVLRVKVSLEPIFPGAHPSESHENWHRAVIMIGEPNLLVRFPKFPLLPHYNPPKGLKFWQKMTSNRVTSALIAQKVTNSEQCGSLQTKGKDLEYVWDFERFFDRSNLLPQNGAQSWPKKVFFWLFFGSFSSLTAKP